MNRLSDIPLYDKVTRLTNAYLGPSADHLVAGQVQHHLHKRPEELLKSDLLKLIDWICAAVSLLTDDTEIVEQYVAHLLRLAEPADNSADD